MTLQKWHKQKSATCVGVGRRAGKGEHFRPLVRPEAEFALWLCQFTEQDDPRCCIYVIAPDGGWPVKVGISQSPDKRLASLQTSQWKRLEVVGCFLLNCRDDAMALERAVHRRFAEDDKWLLGEWVDARAEEAREAIEWAALMGNINVTKDVPTDKQEQVQRQINRRWPYTDIYESNAQKHVRQFGDAY